MLRYAQVRVDGSTIRYATEGAGVPLVLIHGPPFDHRAWAPTIPYLAGHFRIIAPDLPGFGGSGSATCDGSADAMIRAVAGVVTALQLVPCYIAGVSIGGGVALGLAARHPEWVRGLVAVGATGIDYWPETAQARLARTLRFVPGALGLGMGVAPRALARWFLRGALKDQTLIDSALIEQIATALRDHASRRMVVRIFRQMNSWQFIMRKLGGIRVPTLLIWGEHDAVYGLPAAEHLRQAIPNARLITLAAAGHLLSIERPLELASAIRHFCAPPDLHPKASPAGRLGTGRR